MNAYKIKLPRHRPSRAFTLIELLTVIAIIAILAAILIPVTASVRLSGLQAKNISQLRGIGMATLLFAQEHRDRVPQYNFQNGVADNTRGHDASWRSPARALFPANTPGMPGQHPLGNGDYLPDASIFYSPLLAGLEFSGKEKKFYQNGGQAILGYYLYSFPPVPTPGRNPVVVNGQLLSNESTRAWGRTPLYSDCLEPVSSQFGLRGNKISVIHLDGSTSARAKAVVDRLYATNGAYCYYYLATGVEP